MTTTQDYTPGQIVNGHQLNADGYWVPVTAPKTGMSTGAKVAAGIAAALLLVGGGAVVANAMGSDSGHITSSADMTGLTSGEEEFILDVETIMGYDATSDQEEALLWTGQMTADANDMGTPYADNYNDGFVEGFTESGGTEADALAFIDAANSNL